MNKYPSKESQDLHYYFSLVTIATGFDLNLYCLSCKATDTDTD